MANYTEKWIEDLRSAIDYLNADGLDEKHRATLKRACESAMLQALDESSKQESVFNEGKKWRPDDIEVLKQTLEKRGHVNSYADADDALNSLAAKLKRLPASIKRKAVELDMGDRVDWWVAKARHRIAGDGY